MANRIIYQNTSCLQSPLGSFSTSATPTSSAGGIWTQEDCERLKDISARQMCGTVHPYMLLNVDAEIDEAFLRFADAFEC